MSRLLVLLLASSPNVGAAQTDSSDGPSAASSATPREPKKSEETSGTDFDRSNEERSATDEAAANRDDVTARQAAVETSPINDASEGHGSVETVPSSDVNGTPAPAPKPVDSNREVVTRATTSANVDRAADSASASAWHFGGYGELLLSTSFYHPDLKVDDAHYRDSHLDLARFSLFVGNEITKRISFSSEIEFEHGGTGVAREIEWEEFGEYETEVEKGGEIILEQAYLEGRPTDWLALRGGHLLVPVGMTTQFHLPTLFSSSHRPESESRLLPSIWHENGIEAQVRLSQFTIRTQIITGLDSTGFSSSRWIAGGTQRAFERPLVNDVATVLAVDYLGVPNAVIGASLYTSGSNRNRPKRDLYDVGGRVTIGDLHVRFQRGPVKLRGLLLLGHLQNAADITRANASLSSNLGASRTPVASAAYAAWIETAYDVLPLFLEQPSHRLDLFVRYDAYDSMWRAGADFDNPLLQTQALTSGVNYFPQSRVVLKAEYVSRWLNEGRTWGRRQQELNAALGFVL